MRLILKIHLVLGLIAGAFIAIIGVTGVFLRWSRNLIDCFIPMCRT